MKPAKPPSAKEESASHRAQTCPVACVVAFFSVVETFFAGGDVERSPISSTRALRSDRHCAVSEAASVENACVYVADVIKWLAVTREGSIDVFRALRSGLTAAGVNGGVRVSRDSLVTFCFSAADEAVSKGRGLWVVED
jgi:hypothetical protein